MPGADIYHQVRADPADTEATERTNAGPQLEVRIFQAEVAASRFLGVSSRAVVRHFGDVAMNGGEIREHPASKQAGQADIDAAQIGLVHRGARRYTEGEPAVEQVITAIHGTHGKTIACRNRADADAESVDIRRKQLKGEAVLDPD